MAKEYIGRDGLITELDCRVEALRRTYGCFDHYTDGFDDCVDRICDYPTADNVVEVKNIEAWLHEIAMNNVGVQAGDVAEVCEEIISRLNGLIAFDKERRGF